jgi:hypothetical protein
VHAGLRLVVAYCGFLPVRAVTSTPTASCERTPTARLSVRSATGCWRAPARVRVVQRTLKTLQTLVMAPVAVASDPMAISTCLHTASVPQVSRAWWCVMMSGFGEH